MTWNVEIRGVVAMVQPILRTAKEAHQHERISRRLQDTLDRGDEPLELRAFGVQLFLS